MTELISADGERKPEFPVLRTVVRAAEIRTVTKEEAAEKIKRFNFRQRK